MMAADTIGACAPVRSQRNKPRPLTKPPRLQRSSLSRSRSPGEGGAATGRSCWTRAGSAAGCRRSETKTMRARTEVPRQGGFTLLEMLVALTVLGFLMVGLNEGVRTGLGIWRTQTRQISGMAELDSTARLMRSLFGGIPVAPAAAANPGSPAIAIA